MKKVLSLAILGAVACLSLHSENVVIKAPKYFDGPIRDGHELFPDSLVFSSEAEEIVIPDVGTIGRIGDYKFPNLKKIRFGNVDYLPGGLFSEMPQLEEVVFDGMIGHFDCVMAMRSPKLRKITFNGPISSTGGPGIFYDLTNLDSVIFNSVVVNMGVEVTPDCLCPKFKGFTNNGAFLKVYNDSLMHATTIDQLKENPRLIIDMERLAQWQSEILRAKNSKWTRRSAYKSAKILQPILAQLNSPKTEILKSAMEYAWNLGDDVKTNLEILKESPSYAPDATLLVSFSHAEPSDSLLSLSRSRFNLDSIAGVGNDISRIKNLLYGS